MTAPAKPSKRGPKPRKPIKRCGVRGKRTSRRRKERKAKLHDADRMFSELIRTRDGWTCRRCGSIRAPQCAHVVSRRYRATRWSEDNAICLCAGCHMKFTYDPLGWEDWYSDRWGKDKLENLKQRALAGVAHVDYAEVCGSLQLQLNDLKERRAS